MLRRSVAFCRSHPLLPALMSREPSLRLQRLSLAAADRVEPHRRMVASILRRGVEAGELRPDLDVDSSADLICTLHSEYSRRAYANDPLFPLDDAIIDAAVRFIHEAVRRP